MNRKLAWALGMVCYLAALVALAPATLLARLVEQQSQGHLQIAAASGTVWSGQAQLLVQGNAPVDQVAIGPLRWELQPLQLPLGRLQAALALPGGAPR